MSTFSEWVESHVPDLTGRRAIVTGANSGLGFEASRLLAGRGAQVVMAVRNVERGQAAAEQIRADIPSARLAVRRLDLADLTSVRHFAAATLDAGEQLDILLNNAGIMGIPRRETVDGFEMQFGVNHLGHFALTGLLLPVLLANPAARVVTVSSGVHLAGNINFTDFAGRRGYNNWRAYAQSKLANLLFAYELQRRFAAIGSRVRSIAAHPGYAATNLQSVGPTMTGSRLNQATMQAANCMVAQPAAMGALPLVYAATSPDVQGGEYIGPGAMLGLRGFPTRARSSKRSHSQELAERLWSVSEELTGVSYHFAG